MMASSVTFRSSYYEQDNHHLVPAEVIADVEPGAITLTVDQQTVESAPTLGDPHAAPEEGLQRAAREHCLG